VTWPLRRKAWAPPVDAGASGPGGSAGRRGGQLGEYRGPALERLLVGVERIRQVIRGWDEGLVGMRAGGRRLLILPPNYAYGEAGSPPAIKPGETLVFVVDALRVRHP
jgi:hypothetical protein